MLLYEISFISHVLIILPLCKRIFSSFLGMWLCAVRIVGWQRHRSPSAKHHPVSLVMNILISSAPLRRLPVIRYSIHVLFMS